ncbi:hypothetical protein JOC37_001687 [Desulfohalotomaculum tongense]|uniref:DNA double-strand break repair nuclease NurA n=1 Tax=Desulforadius tongensis TaxID=1216062 RepID=UPI00195AE9A2|nr:DNA double-strand break repair nuclease NurA [Desulforadius tongensis]MBM7855294.1 hypothetical protein [Desulforadius tongensis]
MLDLSGLFPHIEAMVKHCRANADNNKQKLKAAAQSLSQLNGRLKEIAKRVQESKTSWLVAEPVEDAAVTHPLPPPPGEYQVLASDGSQLFPDHHEVVLCYLINIGTAALEYGNNPGAELNSEPKLYYREEDLYMEEDGVKRLVDSQRVSALRTLEEAEALVKMSRRCKAGTVVALTDGTLIQWAAEQQGKWAENFLTALVSSYESLRQRRVPLAGYISGSRSTDVINMLRVQLCPQLRVDCDHCARRGQPDSPCESVSGLRDAALFAGWLEYGRRSALFKSNSKVLEKYGEHRIYFFYVNVGMEIIRVEVPRWVALDTEYINTVHSVVVDQAQKGGGYPVCLAEAHRQAVVSGSDRKVFYELVNRKLIESGLLSEITCKSMRKRSVPV